MFENLAEHWVSEAFSFFSSTLGYLLNSSLYVFLTLVVTRPSEDFRVLNQNHSVDCVRLLFDVEVHVHLQPEHL